MMQVVSRSVCGDCWCRALLLIVVSQSTLVAAAEPIARFTPRQKAAAFFCDNEVKLQFLVETTAPIDGRLLWSYSAERRLLARGELGVAVGSDKRTEVELSLRLPAIREGVVYDTQLKLRLVDSRGDVVGQHDRTLWLFPRDPFAGRRQWLRDLKITLYDPEGTTQRVLSEAEVPCRLVPTLPTLETTSDGVVVVGENVSLRAHPALPDILVKLAASGRPVLCLAPSDGSFPFPGSEADQPMPTSVSLRTGDVVREFDKRFSAVFRSPGGQPLGCGLEIGSQRVRTTLSATDSPRGWPWLEVMYPGGGRLIVCGFRVVDSWDTGPTPRYLMMHIFERIAPNTKPPENSSGQE